MQNYKKQQTTDNTHTPQVKVCGLKRVENALECIALGADAIGCVFYPKSPRHVTDDEARDICLAISSKAVTVGVFVNESFSFIMEKVQHCFLKAVQLHGRESPQLVRRLRKENITVIKTLFVNSVPTFDSAIYYEPSAFLVECGGGVLPGGNALSWNWENARFLVKNHQVILAGGLNPENVGKAILKSTPDAVDVSSGVEFGPGRKDISKVEAFIKAVSRCNRKRKTRRIFLMQNKSYSEESGTYMESVVPDSKGHFGAYGGRYVGETLMPALLDLEEAYKKFLPDKAFQNEFYALLQNYAGRPTPLFHAKRLSDHLKGASIYLKREDLAHTGAHKINNTLGQALLARWMGKKKLIAETGAGQHGVATATVAALFGMGCRIFMGEEDIRRQAANVQRMELLGAEVIKVVSGTGTLKDAMNEAMRYWVGAVMDTFYVIGSVAGPHPYPVMVRDFQKVIGEETRKQIIEFTGKLPDMLVACVGGGSNAMGLFYSFMDDPVEMVGVEAAGTGIKSGKHAATLSEGSIGVLHGSKSYVLQDEKGQIKEAHSISAGLDYPGVGPEHALFKDSKRVRYVSVDDNQALKAFYTLCSFEGIIPALESSHAVAWAADYACTRPGSEVIVINLSGRGDKDLGIVFSHQNKDGLL